MADPTDLGGLVVRGIAPEELAQVIRLDATVWGHEVDQTRMRCYSQFLEPDRTVCAFRGSGPGAEMVAAMSAVSLPLTVPGGGQVPMTGLTWLLVHPLVRGTGLMVRLDAEWKAGVRADEPLVGAMLHNPAIRGPAEGFAPAARHADVELRLDRRRRLTDVPADTGRLDYVDKDTALAAMREISDRLAGVRNGWIPRKACTDVYKYSRAGNAVGEFGPMSFVVHIAADGTTDGLLAYRLAIGSDAQGRAAGTMRVAELLTTSPLTEALLWQHCVGNREVHTVVAARRPVDDPIGLRLADPRDLRRVTRDDLYLWVLDVPAALRARRYSRDDSLVVEVIDPTDPNSPHSPVNPVHPVGEPVRVELDGGLDGASCRAVRSLPDLTMSRRALSAAYLGDTSLAVLAAAGQVVEHRAGALRRAAAMFTWSPAPWVQDSF